MTKNPIRIAIASLAVLVFLFAATKAYSAPTVLRPDGGGTGVQSFGGTNRVLFTNVINALTSSDTFTFNGTTLSAPVVAATQSGNATSTFAGNVQVSGNLRVDGMFYAPVSIVSSGNATINGTLTVNGKITQNVNDVMVLDTPLENGTFHGLEVRTLGNQVGGILVNTSGEVRSGALRTSYFPTFYSSGVERMRITTAGNVGVGVTDPAYQFEVGRSTGGTLAISTAGVAGTAGSPLYATLNFLGYNDKVKGSIGVEDREGNTYGGQMEFKLRDTADVLQTRMYISNVGNVGIGTTSPVAKLAVSGAAVVTGNIKTNAANEAITAIDGGTNAVAARFGNAANDLYIGTEGNTAGGFFSGSLANSSVLYSTQAVQTIIGGASRMIVTTAGNVGIGTTNPQAKLEIAKQATFTYPTPGTGTGNINLIGTSSVNDDSLAITFGANGTGGTASTAAAGIYAQMSSSYGSRLHLATTDSFGTGSKVRLTINESGNVGIGTTNPTGGRLHVVGPASNWTQYLAGNTTTSQSYGLLIDAGTNTSDTALRIRNASGSSDYFLVRGDGNVGIGTTSPSKKLSVAGTVAFDGLTASVGAGSLCLTAGKEVVYNAASDNCLSSTRASKHSIEDLSLGSFDVLEQLQPVSFVYNDDASSTQRFGFIAEDAAAADPHLATRNASGEISGLDTNGFLAVIVDALKKVVSRQDDTDARLEALEARLAALESENATLRTGRGVLACMVPF